MAKRKYTYEYPKPSVSVDVVLVSREPKPQVLLIQRKYQPYQGMWALPGGFIEMDETLEESARRELYEETTLKIGKLEQLYTFGDPGRDPRERVISVVFLGRANPKRQKPKAADDAADVAWHPLHRLPPMAFDHQKVLAVAKKRLAADRNTT